MIGDVNLTLREDLSMISVCFYTEQKACFGRIWCLDRQIPPRNFFEKIIKSGKKMVHVVLGNTQNFWVRNWALCRFALVCGPKKSVAGKWINAQISTNLNKIADGRRTDERTNMSFYRRLPHKSPAGNNPLLDQHPKNPLVRQIITETNSRNALSKELAKTDRVFCKGLGLQVWLSVMN